MEFIGDRKTLARCQMGAAVGYQNKPAEFLGQAEERLRVVAGAEDGNRRASRPIIDPDLGRRFSSNDVPFDGLAESQGLLGEVAQRSVDTLVPGRGLKRLGCFGLQTGEGAAANMRTFQ